MSKHRRGATDGDSVTLGKTLEDYEDENKIKWEYVHFYDGTKYKKPIDKSLEEW